MIANFAKFSVTIYGLFMNSLKTFQSLTEAHSVSFILPQRVSFHYSKGHMNECWNRKKSKNVEHRKLFQPQQINPRGGRYPAMKLSRDAFEEENDKWRETGHLKPGHDQ